MRIAEYDFKNLPAVPFNVYFIDHKGSVHPKRIFTVTRKRIDVGKKCVNLYVFELCEYIEYTAECVQVLAAFYVN